MKTTKHSEETMAGAVKQAAQLNIVNSKSLRLYCRCTLIQQGIRGIPGTTRHSRTRVVQNGVAPQRKAQGCALAALLRIDGITIGWPLVLPLRPLVSFFTTGTPGPSARAGSIGGFRRRKSRTMC